MNIFLSSRYSRRNELRAIRDRLQALGHTVISRWLDTEWEQKDDSGGSSVAPAEYREQHAVIDADDVLACDCLIAFTEPPRSGGRGGRHVEFGLAMGSWLDLIVIGHRENIFHHHPDVHFYATLEEAIQEWFSGE